MSSHPLFVVVAVAAFTNSLFAQDKAKPKRLPGDEMIEKYLAAETDRLAKKFMDGAKSLDEWQERLPRLKREYMDMLGLWPIPEKTPLKATVTGEVEAHGVVVEKLHFQSKPGLYVTANLYRPRALSGKRVPAIVYVCGHSGKGRDGNKTAFQEHGFWFANHGYVCIMLDTLQLGEIPGVHHGTYGRTVSHFKSWGIDLPSPPHPFTPSPLLPQGADSTPFRPWWWSAGYTPAGVECWNGVRAIDYLLTRPDVDPDKIGVTGISGGGAATLWIAAADERVKVAVPVSGMSDLEYYVKQKGVNSHCDCMLFYNTYQWDWTTIAALVAPRPMLFANSDKDPIFPMDGNRRIMEKLRKCYALYAADKAHGQPSVGLQEHVSPGGHDYRPGLRVAIFKFFNKHLKGDTTTPVEDSAKYTPLPGKDLRVFPTDADVPKDALNGRIDETFVPRAKVELPQRGAYGQWKTELRLRLATTSLRPLLFRAPTAAPIKVNIPYGGTWSTETGIEIGTTIAPGKNEQDRLNTILIALEADITTDGFQRLHENAEPFYRYGLRLEPRGVRAPWTSKSPPNYFERSHVLLGRTMDQGRVLDIVSRIQSGTWIEANRKGTQPIRQWRVIGRGQAGILAAYAALFESSIKEVVVIDPPKSHKDGPHFLGILRVLDIPDALGLLAPTPLTIIGGNDPAFDRTAEIYRLAGAADKLTRK
jgi:dienelactone hydrolase